MRGPRDLAVGLVLLALAACAGPIDTIGPPPGEADPPQAVVGERLFRETRFAEYFAVRSGGDPNALLERGDPVLDVSVKDGGGDLPGPYRGRSMNCASCHLVDELDGTAGGGVRTYADFAVRSPIPVREDGRTVTPRNSPSLVEATTPREGVVLLHFDGEFTTAESLVIGTITGRNYGWFPDERAAAVANLAAVVRGDDGRGDLAADFAGLPYATLLGGVDDAIPAELRVPVEYRIDVATASDEAILTGVARLITAYLDGLRFSRDASGGLDGSAFDLFLARNDLPRRPAVGESAADFADRLLAALDALATPRFVSPGDGRLERHGHDFAFGPQERAGLQIFLRRADRAAGAGRASGVGHCVTCHALPLFTDRRTHNVGTAQEEYDAVFGDGAFADLEVPDLATRNARAQTDLPPSILHPRAAGRFLSPPSVGQPGFTDLGLWNVFANPSLPEAAAAARRSLCDDVAPEAGACADDDALLGLALARFKTPSLRDLGQSGPYMHTGIHRDLESVVGHYVRFGVLARAGAVRNADPGLASVRIDAADVAPLAAFLRSLDEDYD